jgi:hypothetical protein
MIKLTGYLLALIFGLVSVCSKAQAQGATMICGTTVSSTAGTQQGGKHKTATGELKILFIFAEFPDDKWDTTNTLWPKGQNPQLMTGLVDEVWYPNTSSSMTQQSITHYFNDMSFNTFKVTGKTYRYTAPRTRSQYHALGYKDKDIHREILQGMDAQINYADYDKWSSSGDYIHSYTPDGFVDMLYIIWRNIGRDVSTPKYRDTFQFNSSADGWSHLAANPTYWSENVLVENNTKSINMGFFTGSGITIADYLSKLSGGGRDHVLGTFIHELGHYLLGGNNHVPQGSWGLMYGSGGRCSATNPYARTKLGWNYNTVVSTNISNGTLGDYVTTGNAYEFATTTGEKFYVTNHQRISYWDKPSAVTTEKGIYVMRDKGNVQNDVTPVPADGRFTWTVPTTIQSPWGPQLLPVFKKGAANRVLGYHDSQYIPDGDSANSATNWHLIHFLDNGTSTPTQTNKYLGDGTDAFRIGYNTVFSPWSNPNSHNSSRNATGVGFKIVSVNAQNVYTLNLYVNSAINTNPSKPQDLKVSNVSGKPFLQWQANVETDLASYKVYRAYHNGTTLGAYSLIATVSGTATSYTDNTVTVGCCSVRSYYYKISSYDNSALESDYSDAVAIGIPPASGRAGAHEDEEMNTLSSINLISSPNPFAEHSILSFSLSQPEYIKLTVKNMLGETVAVLAEGVFTKGDYTREFHAENLPEGTYFCTLETQQQTLVQKLMLRR